MHHEVVGNREEASASPPGHSLPLKVVGVESGLGRPMVDQFFFRVVRSIIQKTSLLLAEVTPKESCWPFLSTGLVRASFQDLISEWPSANENPQAPLL